MRKIEAVQLPHLAAGKSLNALISDSKALTSGANISLRHERHAPLLGAKTDL